MPDLERRVVSQRQYAVLAPLVDANQVGQILTVGLTECFAFTVFDPDTKVGIFAHADAADGLVDVLHKELGLLKRLGGRSFRVETVNIAATMNLEMIANRAKGLKAVSDYLETRKVLSRPNSGYYYEHGEANAAYLDSSGLHMVRGGIELTRVEEGLMIRGADRLRDYMFSHRMALPGYEMVYRPSVRR